MAPTFFPKPVIMRWLKAPQLTHSWGGRTRYSVTLPPQNTLQLLSFFDCILLCTTVCTRSCVLSYCCVFQAGKTQSVISCELRGGFTLPLRPVEPVPWNKKSFRWRAILVLLRTLLASIAALSKSPVALLYSVAVAISLFSGWWLCCKVGGGGFTVEGGQTGGKRHADPASFSFSLHPFFFISSPNCSSFFSYNIFRFSVQIVTLPLPMLSFSILYISPASLHPALL